MKMCECINLCDWPVARDDWDALNSIRTSFFNQDIRHKDCSDKRGRIVATHGDAVLWDTSDQPIDNQSPSMLV